MKRWLVIGYGNDIFGDDGVGPATAAAVEDLAIPGVSSIQAHQLMPEMAVQIAASDGVVFVDAALDSGEVKSSRLSPDGDPIFTHRGDPSGIMALTLAAYDASPEAWFVTIPAEDFTFGAGLSAATSVGMSEAVRRICGLVTG